MNGHMAGCLGGMGLPCVAGCPIRRRVARGGRAGIGGHQLPGAGRSQDWVTPRWLLDALGAFDLDPCASPTQPWPTATTMIRPPEDGLAAAWGAVAYSRRGPDGPERARVWLNSPYGPHWSRWALRLADHGRGTMLVFARTETKAFHRAVWGRADAVLFLEGRLVFCRPDGTEAPHNAGGPSCLVAYGRDDVRALERAWGTEPRLGGALVRVWMSHKGGEE